MAGQISAAIKGFREDINIASQQVYYPYVYSGKQNDTSPKTVSYNPKVEVTAGQNFLKAEMQSFVNRNNIRKPFNTFYKTEDRILTFRPPMENIVYSLDVNNVKIQPQSIRGHCNVPNNAYQNLKNSRFVNSVDVNVQKDLKINPKTF